MFFPESDYFLNDVKTARDNFKRLENKFFKGSGHHGSNLLYKAGFIPLQKTSLVNLAHCISFGNSLVSRKVAQTFFVHAKLSV